ncbi:hypothetical protein O9992_23890 [Vibrio lentus]|nr:hypothetical protein [Vibrio lentus]
MTGEPVIGFTEVLNSKQLKSLPRNVSSRTSPVPLSCVSRADLLMCYPYNSVRDYIEEGELGDEACSG